MGKSTGFLEYEREDAKAASPKERIKNFNEFHQPLSKEKQKYQAARCMECGVPFCQSGKMLAGMASGCPINNLIPEWNDLLYNGNMNRLIKGLTRQITSLNLQLGFVQSYVKKLVHVDFTESRFRVVRMNTQLLKMHTSRDLHQQKFPE